MRILALGLLLLGWIVIGDDVAQCSSLDDIDNWFIVLNDQGSSPLSPEKFNNYDMCILDPDSHPSYPLENYEGIAIAYLSIGKAEANRSYWTNIKNASWVKVEKGSAFLIDLDHPQWQQILLEDVIPDILSQNFQGLLLSNLDAPEQLIESFPGQYPEGHQEIRSLITKIRSHYPQLLLISHNGYDLLDELAPSLDGVLAEEVHSMPYFDDYSYIATPQDVRNYRVNVLKNIHEQYNLPIFILDYASHAAPQVIREIRAISLEEGFKPYVAEKGLAKIYDNHPKN
ncbi:MAG: endo alpha-1,4 polygalactosaminidase [Chlamydiota bacterium]